MENYVNWIMASELAARLGTTRAAITMAIKRGRIAACDAVHIGRTVMVHPERAAAAMSRRRAACTNRERLPMGEDSFTTRRRGATIEHRWTDDNGNVVNHPWPCALASPAVLQDAADLLHSAAGSDPSRSAVYAQTAERLLSQPMA